MAKAKLVTRSATTSTVTEDNLNKASALTHAEMDSNLINLRDSSFGIADDSSTVLQVTHDKTITIAGSGTVSTALSGDTLTVTGSGITASSTDTLTNKTFDANGTGNSISNIETADIAAGTLVTAAEGIGSNDNDTTIPTSAAVKAYADSVGGGGSATGLTFVGDDSTGTLISDGETVKIAGGTGITTAMSGDTLTITASGGGGGTITALNNQAENRLVSIGSTTTELDGEANLTFDGTTLTLTGSAALDGVTITDNTISTNRSNDDLRLSANGTGRIGISTDGSDFWSNPLYSSYYGDPNLEGFTMGVSASRTVDANSATRQYVLGISQGTTLSGSSTSNSNFRQRTLNLANSLDMAGYSFTQASLSRGPKAATFGTNTVNSSATASTLYTANAGQFFVSAWGESGYAEGDVTITAPVGVSSTMEIYSAGGTGNFTFTNAKGFSSNAYVDTNDTITNHYLYHAQPGNDGGGGTITNSYGYYVASSTGGVGTNYAFYDASNSLSVFGDIQTQGVSITDNLITTNRSNDTLGIGSNGTGQINLSTTGNFSTSSMIDNRYNYGADAVDNIHGVSLLYREEDVPEITTSAGRRYSHSLLSEWKMASGINTSNSNMRFRNYLGGAMMDMNGSSSTNTGLSGGTRGADFQSGVRNSSATTSTLGVAVGANGGIYVQGGNSSGDINITNAAGIRSTIELETESGRTNTITNAYGFTYYSDIYGPGTGSITNSYGYHVSALAGTNKYAFYDATNSLSVFGDIQTQGVSITDNVISTNRSNDDLIINSSGTGRITISTDGTRIEDSGSLYPKYHFSPANVKGVVLSHELTTNPDTLTGREYGHAIHMANTLTASSSTNSNFTPRSCIFSSQTDMAGYDYTVAALSRGPVGLFASGTVNNSSATTASTLATVKAAQIATGCADYDSPSQDLTINNAIAIQGSIDVDHNGTGDVTVTNGYNFYADHYEYEDSTGAATITNNYGFYYTGSDATNRYAFWDSANVLSRFGAVILANQASDPSGVTDSAHIYAKDVSSSSEVFVRDEAGNVTQISPHNEAGEWQYWSENIKTGKKVRVNMERMIRRLEEITGETFIESE